MWVLLVGSLVPTPGGVKGAWPVVPAVDPPNLGLAVDSWEGHSGSEKLAVSTLYLSLTAVKGKQQHPRFMAILPKREGERHCSQNMGETFFKTQTTWGKN